ncbi:MAG: sigma-70 family RNA polymerase sigma factor, partial [Nostoc sp.]
IGLIKACDRFVPATGNAFSSFAIPYILGEIQHYLRDQWQSIKIPRTDIETKAKVRRLHQTLVGLGRDVSVAEVALGLGITKEKWRELEAIDGNVTISLDELLHEPAQADQDLCNIDVVKHLNKLQAAQRNAIAERFFSNISIKDIAKRQKTSPERIKASINLGLTKIKISLAKEL